MGTAGDLAVLQRRVPGEGGAAFDAAIGTTLAHYCSDAALEHHGGGGGGEHEAWCHPSAAALGEPASIAHSAMLLLALAAWGAHPCPQEQRALLAALAAGIRRQQRSDGSLTVYFGGSGGRLPDAGWQLYGGEAALALARAGTLLGDARLLAAAAAALAAYRTAYRRAGVQRLSLPGLASSSVASSPASPPPEARRPCPLPSVAGAARSAPTSSCSSPIGSCRRRRPPPPAAPTPRSAPAWRNTFLSWRVTSSPLASSRTCSR